MTYVNREGQNFKSPKTCFNMFNHKKTTKNFLAWYLQVFKRYSNLIISKFWFFFSWNGNFHEIWLKNLNFLTFLYSTLPIYWQTYWQTRQRHSDKHVDKHVIWGILYLLSWCVYDFYAWRGRKYNLCDRPPGAHLELTAYLCKLTSLIRPGL